MYDREQPAEPRAIPAHTGSMALPASVLGQPVDVDYHWDGDSASVEDVTVEGVSIHAILEGAHKQRHDRKAWVSMFQLIGEAVAAQIGEEWVVSYDE